MCAYNKDTERTKMQQKVGAVKTRVRDHARVMVATGQWVTVSVDLPVVRRRVHCKACAKVSRSNM
jgi:hypothetical protein